MSISDRYEKLKDEVVALKSEIRQNSTLINRELKKVDNNEREIDIIDKSIIVLQCILDTSRENAIQLFEKTITTALKEVFDETYEFRLFFSKRGNASACDFLIKTGEYNEFLPIRMTQGQLLRQIVSTVLRLVFISLLSGRKLVGLDESFSGIAPDKESIVGELVMDICKKFKIQAVMVTHKETLANYADRIIEIK
jgi:DNA repair ATPase RecN